MEKERGMEGRGGTSARLQTARSTDELGLTKGPEVGVCVGGRAGQTLEGYGATGRWFKR